MSDAERIEQLEGELRNTEHQLAAYRDKIDKDELVRCLRAARDSYRAETYALKDRVAELEEEHDELRSDNIDLRAVARSYAAIVHGRQPKEMAA